MGNKDSISDVAIVGAGVSGIYASYCCGVSGLSCVLFDALTCPGGQCMAFYPDKKVYGVPGMQDVFARDFVELLKYQASSFTSNVAVFSEKISEIKFRDGVFSLKGSSGLNYCAKKIILATGIGDMLPNIPPDIAGLSEAEEAGFVKYYCMKMDFYKDKDVIVAGGGDSAADFAINISRIAKKVTIIHRRDIMTCDEQKKDIISKLENVTLKLSHNILAIESGKRIVTNCGAYEADYIVFCYGFRASPSTISGLKSFGIHMEANLLAVDIDTMQTGSDKVFAIGDVASYKNKKKNIVSCFFEADRAVRIIKSQMVLGDI